MCPARFDVFKLLADPTRRALLDLLLRGERNANDLVRSFPASQQAISLHLQSLRKARLVEVTKHGRYRKYRLRAEPIREVFDWSAKYKPFFDPLGHAWLFSSVPEVPASATRNSKAHTGRRKR